MTTLMENVSVRLLRGEARRAPEILGQVTMFLSKMACNVRPQRGISLPMIQPTDNTVIRESWPSRGWNRS